MAIPSRRLFALLAKRVVIYRVRTEGDVLRIVFLTSAQADSTARVSVELPDDRSRSRSVGSVSGGEEGGTRVLEESRVSEK